MNRQCKTAPGQIQAIAEITGWVRGFCQLAWPDVPARESLICQLELAVHETWANICRHAIQEHQKEMVDVSIELLGAAIVVEMRYRGAVFDRSRVRPPNFDGSQTGGFGCYLIERAVDQVEYFQDELGFQKARLHKLGPT